MKKLKNHTVKMNLTMDQEFYTYLQELAGKEYLKVSTFVKQLLMKTVLDGYHGTENPFVNEIKEEMNQENNNE